MKYQNLVEVYKTAQIFQHVEAHTFCAFYEDGSWYGWCDSIETVRKHVDARQLGDN